VGGTGQVRCTTASLAPGASAMVSLAVSVVDCATPDASLVVASATVSSSTADPNPALNNSASVGVQIGNAPPVVTLNGPSEVTLECRSPFVDPGATAVDACDGPVATTVSGTVDVNRVGSYMVSYGAVDSAGGQAVPATRIVLIQDTTAPAIDLVDLTILLPGVKIVIDGVTITINGQSQPLPSGTVVILGQTITWSGTTITINGQTFMIDGKTVVLLPPLGQYQSFALADLISAVADSCDAGLGLGAAVITHATSDEPENAQGNRDGNTINDIAIAADCRSVRLRVERDNGGNGRVYTVGVRVRDASGNPTVKSAKVMCRRRRA
jgi:hypothetical protein